MYPEALNQFLTDVQCEFYYFTGSGKFSIGFNDFCVAGITLLTLENSKVNLKSNILKIRELDAAVKSEKVHFDFKNLVSSSGDVDTREVYGSSN